MSLKTAVQIWQDNQYVQADPAPISEEMLAAARAIRGEKPPAIIIHGVMPRSGTVFVGELLRSHPAIEAYPNELWEMPLLNSTPAVLDLQRHFLLGYKQNSQKIPPNDFLALVGASFIRYLHTQIATESRLLMKVPLARQLDHFPLMFPFEQCVMLLRDGRDLTASTLKSWPSRNFDQVVCEWRDATRCMLAQDHPLYRYEEVVADPHTAVRSFCDDLNLDVNAYPFASIDKQPLRGSSDHVKGSGWETVEKQNNFKSVGRWEHWTSKHKDRFKQLAGDELMQAGYVNDQNW